MTDSTPLDQLRSYATALIAESEETNQAVPAFDPMGSRTRPRRRPFWARPRMVAATAFFVVANVGLAAAADSAVPGDLLYPVDLTYEAVAGLVGLQTGGPAERLDEARVLLLEGREEDAVRAASHALDPAAQDEQSVLEDVATEIADSPPGANNVADLYAAISSLLETIRSAQGSGNARGTDVKAAARLVAETARGKPFARDQGPGKIDTAPNELPTPAGGTGDDTEEPTDAGTTGNNGSGNGNGSQNGNGNGPQDGTAPGNGNGSPNGNGGGQP